MVIRVGVLGLGAIGAWHARIVAEGGDLLAAVCDSDPARAQAHAYGAQVFTDVDAFLAAGLDAVVIATPEGLHEAHALAALERGLAVLIEKPVAPDLPAMRLIAAAAKGALVMAAHVERFEAGTALLHDALGQGICGRVSTIMARRQFGPAEVGRFAGSSTLRVLGVHDFDLVRWLHPGPITAVQAMGARGAIHAATGLHDHVVTTLTFADGAIASVESGWTLPASYQSYATPAGWGAAGNNRVEVFGDTGWLSNDMSLRHQPLLAFDAAEGFRAANLRHQTVVHGRVQGALRMQMEHFLDSVRHGTPPLVGIDDALRAVALLDAAERALASGMSEIPAL